MDIETLQIFVEVMRRGSFAAVARERRVAPSSVSRAVAGLERELGVRLFQRSTRRLSPTEAGVTWFERVEPIVVELEQARLATVEAARTPRGVLRFTAPHTFAQVAIVPLLPAFSARHPELSFELLLTDTKLDLVADRVDVAVRLGRLADSSLVARRLAAMTYAVCASPGYLEARGVPARPASLSEHECLRYPVPGQPPRWRFRQGADEVEVPIQGRFTLSNGVAIRDLAVAGVGVAMLPRWNVARELASGALVEVLTGWEATASAFDLAAWILYPSREYLPLKVRVFVDYLLERFRP